MTALEIDLEDPLDPVIRDQNPPVLNLTFKDKSIAPGMINCFVQGDNQCRISNDPDTIGDIQIVAEQPLTGRRNKYTLTVLGEDGRWHWYSHLWINAKRPVPSKASQP